MPRSSSSQRPYCVGIGFAFACSGAGSHGGRPWPPGRAGRGSARSDRPPGRPPATHEPLGAGKGRRLDEQRAGVGADMFGEEAQDAIAELGYRVLARHRSQQADLARLQPRLVAHPELVAHEHVARRGHDPNCRYAEGAVDKGDAWIGANRSRWPSVRSSLGPAPPGLAGATPNRPAP